MQKGDASAAFIMMTTPLLAIRLLAVGFLVRCIAPAVWLLLFADSAMSADTGTKVDTWNSIVADFRSYAVSTNSPPSSQSLVSRLQKLVSEDWTNAPQNMNAIFSMMAHSTNFSSHLQYRLAETVLLMAKPPAVGSDGILRQQYLTNILCVVEITKEIYSGIDPQFNPDNAPGNKVIPPQELILQGYQFPSADKAYTNSLLWAKAVDQHKARVREYDDQIGRRNDYARLLRLLESMKDIPAEHETIIRQAIMNSHAPVVDKERLKGSLAPDAE